MISETEKINILSRTDFFKVVPNEQLLEISRALQLEKVPAGNVLFREGEQGDKFYIVHSGRLRVFLRGEDGIESDLNELAPGDCFGEMALLTDEARSCDIETLDESLLLVLTKDEFDSILKAHPEIYKNIIRYMTKLLKSDERKILGDIEYEHKIARLSIFDFLLIGIVVIFFSVIFNLANPNRINVLPEFYDTSDIARIAMYDAKKKYDEGQTVFVDARPASFYDTGHIVGAINLPMASFGISYMYMSEEDKEKDIIVYGRSIGALYDEAVARQLLLYGHENISLLRGEKQFLPLRWFTFDTWKESGFPIEGIVNE